ncbi:hypothetical protein CN151_24275 [Sinorhizobium meliloti]|nr:hypothetical protein CN220_18795 [Sinorhizobium meliloti]RVH47989.1 hypothetical protein CN212_18045 [Sinorhizobium meliloti]RVI70202.1 hypothetical protein CN187_06920 [Sinorhizobium meliloti]RVJ53607.1 hypothetical protein CN175_11655 [Sinorhizobium meliloti]RVJ79990.1 hypothetical protein CN171_01995 [Sinorhizobium meliloti]
MASPPRVSFAPLAGDEGRSSVRHSDARFAAHGSSSRRLSLLSVHGRRDKRRAPRVSFAPLAGRRCRQADEGQRLNQTTRCF